MQNGDLRGRMQAALGGIDADYVELRVETSRGSHIRYRGRELEEIGQSSSLGGSVCALVGGGWGLLSTRKRDQPSRWESMRCAEHRSSR